MDKYQFPCDPSANLKSVISGPHYRFTVIDDNVLRYEWAADGVFEDRASTFAINRNFSVPEFRIEDKEDQLDIVTPSYQLSYNKQRFSPHGFFVSFFSKQSFPTDRQDDWRYGTPPANNLGGTARTLDEVDGRCDMGLGIISRAGYSVLDDSKSMLFDGKGFVAPRRRGDRIDGYLFVYGLDYKGAMRSFYAISGSQPRVPRWCLGNWWSRYYAYGAEEYLALMDMFKAKEIPLSVAIVDMDWHLVREDIVPHAGWTGYTWNKALFPDPEGFTKALHERRLRIALNDHPGAGIHHHEDIYEEMAVAVHHDTTHKAPILFDATSAEFMHACLTVLYRKLEAQGEDFRWIDWQQGEFSRLPGIDPLWVLNHFHYLDTALSQGESQAIIFSRYGGPGSHRYPVGFSGDSVVTWASLEFQPEFTATASNIGYGWWSHDIGGHMPGLRDDEMLVRWVQLAVFSPILRLHSTQSPWMSKEPWLYRPESETVIRDLMQLRHRLVPYIYSVAGAQASLPLIQPLYWNHPGEESAYKFPKQYYFGSALVAAPILQPRNPKTNLAKTRAWVPPARHADVLTGVVYDGAQEIAMYRPLSRLPLLAAEGSIIPLDAERVPLNGCPTPKGFEVVVVVGGKASLDILENEQDDEDSQSAERSQRSIPIRYDQAAGRLQTVGMGRAWTFRFLATKIDPSSIRITIDGTPSAEARCITEFASGVPTTVVGVQSAPKLESVIVVDVGPDPRLVVTDHSPHIRSLLLDFQIPYLLKDDIWGIVQASQPVTRKMARLLSLELEQDLLGPIAELLQADSREIVK